MSETPTRLQPRTPPEHDVPDRILATLLKALDAQKVTPMDGVAVVFAKHDDHGRLDGVRYFVAGLSDLEMVGLLTMAASDLGSTSVEPERIETFYEGQDDDKPSA